MVYLTMGIIGSVAFIIGVVIGISISKESAPTVDDPTGEKKQKVMDSINKIIEDVKSTV